MEHPVVEKILREGMSAVNLSMLGEEQRKRILADVGEKLWKQARFREAIDVMAGAGEHEKLAGLGDGFMSEGRTELATLCFIPTRDKGRLNKAAMKCVEAQNYRLAAAAYEAADNIQMAAFIKENFCR